MDRCFNFILYSDDLITLNDDSSDSENYAPLESDETDPIVTIQPEEDLEEYYYMEDHTEYTNSDSNHDFRELEILNNMTANSPQLSFEGPVTIQTSEDLEPTESIFSNSSLSDIIQAIPTDNNLVPREDLGQYGYICRVSTTINENLDPDETAYTLWSHLLEDWRRALQQLCKSFYIPATRQHNWNSDNLRED